MKKQKQQIYKRPKRTTFLKLFLKSASCGLLLTGIFAGMLYQIKEQDIYKQVREEVYSFSSRTVSRLSDEEMTKHSLNAYLGAYTYYNAILDENYLEMDTMAQYVPNYSQNCYALSAILDEDKNILYSNKETLQTVIRIDDTENSGAWYACNLEACPEIWQKYQDYVWNSDRYRDDFNVKLHSAYVNTKEHLFVPHEYDLIYSHLEGDLNGTLYSEQINKTEKNLMINYDHPDYELIVFPEREENTTGTLYPSAFTAYFRGVYEPIFDAIYSQAKGFNDNFATSGMFGVSQTARIYYHVVPIWRDGQKNYFVTIFQIDVWNPHIKKIYLRTIGIFLLSMLIIAYFWSMHKNRLNQVIYQYEDYQRNLINNLAHDLKTPLMAVSGYAENLLTSYRMEEEPKRYLQSILENINYTDSMINQTLEFNKMQEIQKLRKSVCSLHELTEKALRKYEILLEEHQIAVTISGTAEIMANYETMTSAIENLISNAVKYTAVGGEINIEISDKTFRIDNTVTGKTETSALLLPFVKGDQARAGKSGSGLGLSIADQAIRANGFRLEISCTESAFTAVIHF